MENIKHIFDRTPASYLESCLRQRNPGDDGAGSRFLETQTIESLASTAWTPYEHPAIAAPARGFVAPIAGHLGVVHLGTLPFDTEVTLEDAKKTGFVQAAVKLPLGPEVDFTVLLVGPDDDGQEIVWTFFPGEPISPSTIASEGLVGKTITLQDAINMGFMYAKVT